MKTPRAPMVTVHHCGDPTCDVVHLVARKLDGKPICEISLDEEMLLGLLDFLCQQQENGDEIGPVAGHA